MEKSYGTSSNSNFKLAGLKRTYRAIEAPTKMFYFHKFLDLESMSLGYIFERMDSRKSFRLLLIHQPRNFTNKTKELCEHAPMEELEKKT